MILCQRLYSHNTILTVWIIILIVLCISGCSQQSGELLPSMQVAINQTTESETTSQDINTIPTGLPNGYYEQPMIMYNGTLYRFYATGISESLPDGFEYAGTIQSYDGKNIPTEDFQATGTDLKIGQEIYSNPEKTDVIKVRYELGEGWTGYASFYTDGANKIDEHGFDIEEGTFITPTIS